MINISEFFKKILGLHLDPEEKRILDAINKSGYKTMRVVGRGTLMVDPIEVTSTAKFKEHSEKNKESDNKMTKWISLKKEQHPISEQFLAAWFDGDSVNSIELYITHDGVDYWNLNSGNLNTFGGKRDMQKFTHWLPVPTERDD